MCDPVLRSCPFCGSSGVVARQGSSFRWIVAECVECGARCGEVRQQWLGKGTVEEWERNAERDVAEEWNKRHYDAEMAALRAENTRLNQKLAATEICLGKRVRLIERLLADDAMRREEIAQNRKRCSAIEQEMFDSFGPDDFPAG